MQQDYQKARNYCYEALSKCDYCKVFHGELGQLLITQLNDSELGIAHVKKCMAIENDVITAREQEWNNKAYNYNLISIGYFNLKDYANALLYVDMAITLDPNVEAYKQNKQIYINAYEI